MKKLDKKVLKALIMESLSEMEGDVPPEQVAAMAQDPDRVRSTEAEGMVPEDIAGYFRQIGDELQQRISDYDKAPKAKIAMKSPEELKAALDEMGKVQKEIEELKKFLQDLEKRHMQTYDSEE